MGPLAQALVVRGMWRGVEVAIKQPKPPKDAKKKDAAFGSSSAHDSFAQAVRREERHSGRVQGVQSRVPLHAQHGTPRVASSEVGALAGTDERRGGGSDEREREQTIVL